MRFIAKTLAAAFLGSILLTGCGGGGGDDAGGDSPPVVPGPDTTPAAFTFVDQTGVAPSTVITSAPVTITGINAAAAVTVANGTYSVGCTATYVASAGSINNGQTVCARHTSSAADGTATNTVLTVGGVSDTFTSTTAGTSGAAVGLLPFLAGNGDVRLFDPTAAASDSNPATVDSGLTPPGTGTCNDCFDKAETFYTGTVTGSVVSNLRAARLAYVKGGAVYKLNLTKGVSNAPVQVSALTDVCRIVRSETTDLANVDNTAVVIERQGTGDTSCGSTDDNVVTVIRLNTPSAGDGSAGHDDIALAPGAGNPLHARTDALGVITGYVSFEITARDPALVVELVGRDANLGNPVSLTALESSLGLDMSGAHLERADLTHLYVTATPAGGGLTLFRIESGGSLSAALYTFTGYNGANNPIQDGLRDGTNLYFSDRNLLLRMPVDASAQGATEIVTTMPCEPQPEGQSDPCLRIENRALDVDTGRVVFEAQDDDITPAGGVFSAATGADNVAATLLAHNPDSDANTRGPFAVIELVAKGRAYINIAYHNAPTNSVDALKVATDGTTPVATTSAYWAGSTRATTFDLATDVTAPTESIFLARRVGLEDGSGSDTLKRVNPADGVEGAAVLGVIENDASVFLSINVHGLGTDTLARVEKNRSGDLDYDTYVLETDTASSLAPLAQTSGANDIPLDSLQRLTGNLCLVCL